MLQKPKSLKIKSIKLFTLNIDEYISINFAISNEANNKSTIACFIRHFYIVNNFKANILLDNNIFDSKNAVVHISQQKFIIDNCGNFSISLKVVVKNNDGERIKRIIRSKINVTISAYSCFTVSIKYRGFKLPNRDMLFNFNNIKKLNQKNNVFSHIINANFFVVQIRNIINKPIFIAKNKQLNTLIDYKKNDCYLTNSKIRYFVVES